MSLTQLTLADGRLLDIQLSGPPDGVPLVNHHGTPGACPPSPRLKAAAHAAGLRLVSYSRAGYGGSTRQPGRVVADVAADVMAILDHLGVERAVTLGTSGGGPHALACAALLPHRIAGAAVVAGLAPFDSAGLDFLAGMGADNVTELGLALQGEAALRPWLQEAAEQMRGVSVDELIDGMSSLLSDVDRAALSGEFGEHLCTQLDEALRTGVDGWADDDLAFLAPWGFEVADISRPVFLWQGDADLMVPFAHGRWLAAHIPGVTAHLMPGQGHLSLGEAALDEIVAELLSTL